jgi:energy-coupling factor transporter ATP-binding protein EcfA2
MPKQLKVIYVDRDQSKIFSARASHENVLILVSNNWDDFSHKTTFQTHCQIQRKDVAVGNLQILIENELTSSTYLNKLIANGWSGEFPIPATSYISVPGALTFYEQIEGNLDLECAIGLAQTLRDAGYLTKVRDDEDALRLASTTGFRQSLQREQGAVKAFLDGWKVFGKQTVLIGNQEFIFQSTANTVLTLHMRFSSASPLPHDINVLIGPNGIGKSQLLMQIVTNLLDLNPEHKTAFGFLGEANFSQIVVVSYSPFELFRVDTFEDSERRDHDVYKYFGMRGRQPVQSEQGQIFGKVGLGREFPKKNAAHSLIGCLVDDQKYGAIKDWSKKVATMERVLKRAFSFDRAAIAVDVNTTVNRYFSNIHGFDEPFVDGEFSDEDGNPASERYIPICSDRISELKPAELKASLRERVGVVFLKDGKPIQLSSGQRLFSYIVINILGAIRRNSLILVDEPELFLHPNLEIDFLRMLKSILASYNSKALIATHSIVTVREIPRDCVHVLEKTIDGIVIKNPPFETFGGDVQRISSYVFGDKAVSKPYEDWLKIKLEEYGSAASLIEALGTDINEELIIEIHAMDRK